LQDEQDVRAEKEQHEFGEESSSEEGDFSDYP